MSVAKDLLPTMVARMVEPDFSEATNQAFQLAEIFVAKTISRAESLAGDIETVVPLDFFDEHTAYGKWRKRQQGKE